MCNSVTVYAVVCRKTMTMTVTTDHDLDSTWEKSQWLVFHILSPPYFVLLLQQDVRLQDV